MIHMPPTYDPDAPVIVIDIGNTTIGVATWQSNNLRTPLTVSTPDEAAFQEAWAGHVASCAPLMPGATVIASVVPTALERVRALVVEETGKEALVIGESLPLPLDVSVSDRRSLGVDRVCTAAAVYDRLQSACTVVTFGTAITVDLVDDDGAFLGGAILPGLRMQLKALHEFTAVLPEAAPGFPEKPYGRNTVEAIQNGVCRGITGAVRGLVESYATALNRWPQVVATGGDAEFLAPECDFLDNVVSHLTLRGVGLTFSKHMAAMGA